MHQKIAIAAFTMLMAGMLSAAEQPELRVEPATGLIDAPFHVVLTGVLPGSRVTIDAARPDARGRIWTAIGEYQADADGRVDVDVSPSLGGTYEGVSPHSLWCAALPVPPQELGRYVAELPHDPELGTAPRLQISAADPVTVTARIGGVTIATTKATRTYDAGLRSEEVVAQGGVRGVLYLPPDRVAWKIPVVVLAGSGGGLPLEQAALLAGHGHPALAQGIFGYKDLPSDLSNIPLEMFRSGAKWLEHRTGVARVAVMGTSRGSEAAGLAASYFPQDFAAAVVIVPSHLSNGAIVSGRTGVAPAWTYGGKPIPADRGESDSNDAAANDHDPKPPGFIGTPYYLDTWSDPRIAAADGIPFERMSGPVLAIGGGADQMWPSFIGAVRIGQRLAAHGLAQRAEVKIYPGAGHMLARVGTGGPLSSFIFHPVAKEFMATGGLPNANCEASYDAWSEVLQFLAKIRPRTE